MSLRKRLQCPRRAVVVDAHPFSSCIPCFFFVNSPAALKVCEQPCVHFLISTPATGPELVFLVWCKRSEFSSVVLPTLRGTLEK